MTTTAIPTDTIIKTASTIKKIAYVIAGIGTLASYGTQATLLHNNGLGYFSYVIPATIDLLAIGAAMALQLPSLDNVTRKIAGTILTITVMVSIVANVWDAHSAIAGAAHAWPVVAYLLGELLANRVRAYAARLMVKDTTPVVAPTPVPTPAQMATPMPHRTRTAPTTRRTSHAHCTHAATPRDRAVCRSSN